MVFDITCRNILSLVIIIFLVLETMNVLTLYFAPGTSRGNGLGVFIALLIVILIFGNDTLKVYSVVALIISISTFYWRLYPAIKKLDNNDQLSPKGYARTLGIMILNTIVIAFPWTCVLSKPGKVCDP